MESPVGSNGLYIHMHDLFTYSPNADIEALKVIALAKWKAALRKHGLHCSKRGVDISTATSTRITSQKSLQPMTPRTRAKAIW